MRIKDMHPIDPMDFDPFRGFNNLVNSFMRGFDLNVNYPKVDVIEEKDKVIVEADMPGVDKKDIKVRINEDSITLKAHVDRAIKQEDKNYYREERNYADYYREIPLPAAVKKEGSKATFKNGTLVLELQKKEKDNDENDVNIE